MRELPGLAGFDIMDRWAADVNAADEAELLAGLVERLGGSHIHIDLANEAAARAEARAERSARRVRPLQQADWRPSGRLTEFGCVSFRAWPVSTLWTGGPRT